MELLELLSKLTQSQPLQAEGGFLAAGASSPLEGIVGGTLSGMGGGPLGMLLGAGTGLVSFANKRRQLDMMNQIYDDMVKSKATDPTYYAANGGLVPKDDETGISRLQTEKGEVAAMKDGTIVDVKSTKTHKQMSKKEVTDVLPAYTLIGDHKTILKKKDADKVVISSDPLTYSENNKDGKKYKETTVGDLFKNKKEMTLADTLKAVRSKVPMPSSLEDYTDPFVKATADANMELRKKYLDAVMMMAAKENKLLKTQLKNNAGL